MKVEEAARKIRLILGHPISSLLEDKTDKGNFGKALEKLIGLKHSTKKMDFEDGELKTNDFYKDDNKSKETIKVRQYSSNNISELLEGEIKFKQAPIYDKLKNTLYVTTIRYLKNNKKLNTDKWHFGHLFHIYESAYPETFKVLEADYIFCCKTIRNYVSQEYQNIQIKNKHIVPFHTISGHFLQIRTAGAKNKKGNYTPIIVNHKNGALMLCNKPICFMLKTNFLTEVGIRKIIA